MPKLIDDFPLLDAMLTSVELQPARYRAGPYWEITSTNAVNEIKRCGIQDFRGSSSAIGSGYTDCVDVDVRHTYNHGVLPRIARLAARTYPLNLMFDAQIRCTDSHVSDNIRYAQEMSNSHQRPHDLMERYRMPYSLLGGCRKKVRWKNEEVSLHYLSLLDQHDYVASLIDFRRVRSILEIGGGFGVNVHLLLENYPNIRKVAYLDIPPNLYVGTQYLKAFYGDDVRDFREFKDERTVKFAADNRLEILCIAPWQIEQLGDAVDLLMNANSFVEMPRESVQNYADHAVRDGSVPTPAIALVTYDAFDRSSIPPHELPRLFAPIEFDEFQCPRLLETWRQNLFFVSLGRFGRLRGSPSAS